MIIYNVYQITQKYLKIYDSYLLDKNVFMTTKMIETMAKIYTNVDKINFVDPSIGAVPLLGLNDLSSHGFNDYLRDKMNGKGIK